MHALIEPTASELRLDYKGMVIRAIPPFGRLYRTGMIGLYWRRSSHTSPKPIRFQELAPMLAEQVRIGNIEGVHSEVGPMFDPEDDKGFPTWDEQFYRIGGTTTGGVFSEGH